MLELAFHGMLSEQKVLGPLGRSHVLPQLFIRLSGRKRKHLVGRIMVLGHRVQGPREWQFVWNNIQGTVPITRQFLLKRLYVNSLEVLPCQTGSAFLQLPNNRIDGLA